MVAYAPRRMRILPRLWSGCRAVRPLLALGAGGGRSRFGSNHPDARTFTCRPTAAQARAYVAGMDVVHFSRSFRGHHHTILVARFRVAGTVGARFEPSLACRLHGFL